MDRTEPICAQSCVYLCDKYAKSLPEATRSFLSNTRTINIEIIAQVFPSRIWRLIIINYYSPHTRRVYSWVYSSEIISEGNILATMPEQHFIALPVETFSLDVQASPQASNRDQSSTWKRMWYKCNGRDEASFEKP